MSSGEVDGAASAALGAEAAVEAEVAYAKALAELETILAELEDDRVDVDALSGKVRRAAMLIDLCRTRIESARMEVERIVATLAPPGDEEPRRADS